MWIHLGLCGVNALLPNISLRVEYLSSTNTWEPLTGSPYTAAPVAQTAPSAPTWVHWVQPLITTYTKFCGNKHKNCTY